MKFNGRLLIIGCGSVSQCEIPLVLDLIEMSADKITIMDLVDNKARVKDALKRGVKYDMKRLTRENYQTMLPEDVSAGDMIIDLAWNIEAVAILQWCRENKILYVNTSV